jgi:hypothetical protein
MFYLMSPWAVLSRLKDKNSDEAEKEWKKLQWVHYYFKKLTDYKEASVKQKKAHKIWKSLDDEIYPDLEESTYTLIHHMGDLIENGRDEFNDPNKLLETLMILRPDSKAQLAVLWGIAGGDGLCHSSALEKGLQKITEAFNDRNKTGFERAKAAKSIIHIFRSRIPERLGIWGGADVPFCRLSNILKTLGCDMDGLSAVVQHCIRNSPQATKQETEKYPEIFDCIAKLGI